MDFGVKYQISATIPAKPIEGLKTTDVLKTMVEKIGDLRSPRNLLKFQKGHFSLRYVNTGQIFYQDPDFVNGVDPELKLMDFFRDCAQGQEPVIYVEVESAGGKNLFISNATDQRLWAHITYKYRAKEGEIVNEESHVGAKIVTDLTNLNLNGEGAAGHNTKTKYSKESKDKNDTAALAPHKSWKDNKIAINSEIDGTINIEILDDTKEKTLTEFTSHADQHWIVHNFDLENSKVDKGACRWAKSSCRNHYWETSSQKLDPHAKLREGKKCKVCNFLNE
jgi:hypothetical protein